VVCYCTLDKRTVWGLYERTAITDEFASRTIFLHLIYRSHDQKHDKTIIQQQINVTDQQIDRLVYELYGLTDEEIKTVEEQTSLSIATKPILENTLATDEV
jgi:hypothetical protein